MIQLTKCLFHLLFFGHVFDTVCMFHKRQRPDCTGTPAQKLQRCIVDKFLTNGLTGKEAQTWVNHGSDAGLGPFDKYRGTPGKNSKRNMLKKCMRGRGWPKLYRANVTVFDKKKQRSVRKPMSFLLPHEVAHAIATRSNVTQFCSTTRLGPDDLTHYEKHHAKWGGSMVAVGLWMDGTPYNWDRSDSLESVAISFPGNETMQSMRIPIAGITKRHMLKEDSIDDILEVLAWSFRCLADGHYPSARHDGTVFQSGLDDSQRSRLAGKPLAVKGLVTEVRGDWKMYKDVLRLPGWNDKDCCCC